MAKSLTQTVQVDTDAGAQTTSTTAEAVKTINYGLDSTGRINTIVATSDGAETNRTQYRFAGTTDSPAVIRTSGDAGQSWTSTRYVAVPGLGMTAQVSGGETSIQLANLHGDVVATIDDDLGTASYTETDEFGNPAGSAEGSDERRRYGYLGTHQRPAGGDSIGGLTLMGVRLYNPAAGQFLTTDPVCAANPTPYVYPQDPVNYVDTTGAEPFWHEVLRHSVMASTCASFGRWACAKIADITALARRFFKSGTHFGNFQRHFSWIVGMAVVVNPIAARAMGAAHEYGLLTYGTRDERYDTRRDRKNNATALTYYYGHTTYLRRLSRTYLGSFIKKLGSLAAYLYFVRHYGVHPS